MTAAATRTHRSRHRSGRRICPELGNSHPLQPARTALRRRRT